MSILTICLSRLNKSKVCSNVKQKLEIKFFIGILFLLKVLPISPPNSAVNIKVWHTERRRLDYHLVLTFSVSPNTAFKRTEEK